MCLEHCTQSKINSLRLFKVAKEKRELRGDIFPLLPSKIGLMRLVHAVLFITCKSFNSTDS